MFRQEEVFIGGWQDKTIESMQHRRFEYLSSRLPPLGTQRLEQLSPPELTYRLEQSWQGIARKPMRMQQLDEIWRGVLRSINIQADCLSFDEHELVERALILGGSAQIEDMREMEAARALALRLWAAVGLINGKPYIEIEKPVLRPAAKAMARREHGRIRSCFGAFNAYLDAALYRSGAIDDRAPQQMIINEVLHLNGDVQAEELARRYLWASYDCVDYSGGVLLLHRALAEPQSLLAYDRQRINMVHKRLVQSGMDMDILPEEIPFQRRLEASLTGSLRDGCREHDTARSIRFLCKQGAPLWAMEEVLSSMLIVLMTPAMRAALRDMYYGIPKWIECMEQSEIQFQ